MTDHTMFVLAAYAVAFVVLGALVFLSLRGHAQARREVARLEALMPGRPR